MTSRRQAAARRRNKNKETGSSQPGEPVFLLVGIFGRAHGVRGEILMRVMTDFPERIQPDITLYIGDSYRPHTVSKVRNHNKGFLIALNGYTTRGQVESLAGQGVFVRADDRPPLPDGEYYLHQLIGLQVITDDDQLLGTLNEMIETGANPVYVVKPDTGKDILLPATDEVILKIDIENKKIIVHLLEGLIPE